MADDEMERDLRAAVDERLAARLEANRARRDGRRQRLAELHRRRQHGLQQRHATKLARLRDQTTQDPDESHPPHASPPPKSPDT